MFGQLRSLVQLTNAIQKNLALWTPHPCGHFLPGPFVFLIYSYQISFSSVDSGHLANVDSGFHLNLCNLWPVATPSFTSVDTSLLWTLFVRPLGVRITEVLLYIDYSAVVLSVQ